MRLDGAGTSSAYRLNGVRTFSVDIGDEAIGLTTGIGLGQIALRGALVSCRLDPLLAPAQLLRSDDAGDATRVQQIAGPSSGASRAFSASRSPVSRCRSRLLAAIAEGPETGASVELPEAADLGDDSLAIRTLLGAEQSYAVVAQVGRAVGAVLVVGDAVDPASVRDLADGLGLRRLGLPSRLPQVGAPRERPALRIVVRSLLHPVHRAPVRCREHDLGI